jgi:hypothetical protein
MFSDTFNIRSAGITQMIYCLAYRVLGQRVRVGLLARDISLLHIILYRCETLSLTLREEHRLRVLRRIFGSKRYEVMGGWRKLHNEELHNLCSLPNIIRMIKLRMRWAGHVA